MKPKSSAGTCYFLGHSHLDAAWLWSFKETKEVFRNSCETVLDLMEKRRFVFCQSSAQYYKWLEEMFPETFERVRKKVREGQWEIVGGTWVEPDGNLPSGESFVRQFLYGKRYFAEKFGVDVRVAWFPDSFGYASTLPQIMKKAGMEYFYTQKMLWNDTTVFPYYFFSWTAPDGSSILSHQGVGAYDEEVREPRIVEQMKQLKLRHKIDDLLVLYGKGDHGGGVTEEMLERASEFVKGEKPVGGEHSTFEKYMKTMTKKFGKGEIPEISDELYFQFHRGTYTTQARTKSNNRRAECLLEAAEKFSTIAQMYGRQYPSEELGDAWEKLLLNQFHDVLPGSSIPEVYGDSAKYFESIFGTVERVTSESLSAIASRVDTSGTGKSVLVFNPLSWERSDVVAVSTDQLGGNNRIVDGEGLEVTSQVVGDKTVFVAEGVPSIGYKEYRATGGPRITRNTKLTTEDNPKEIVLQNEFLRVKVDKESGLVTSVFDKRNRTETLEGPGNLIQIFEDFPVRGRTCVNSRIDAAVFDAWEVFIYQQPGGVRHVQLEKPIEVKLVERWPVMARVRVRYRYRQEGRPASTFTVEITLCDKVPLVRFSIEADWHAKHRLAKVAFPLKVHSDFTTYEAPYGCVTRRNPISPEATLSERSKYEVPGQKWIDHTSEDGRYGVSLLNDCKYGFDVGNDVVRMTLLRSATYPFELRAAFNLPPVKNTENEVTDQGAHQMGYALYPHGSDFREALTARRAYEFNCPMMPVVDDGHEGELPKTHSFISAKPENVILTVVKKAEDSDDVVLRLYETAGKATNAKIRLAGVQSRASETDLMEREVASFPVKGEVIDVPVSGNSITTVRAGMRR